MPTKKATGAAKSAPSAKRGGSTVQATKSTAKVSARAGKAAPSAKAKVDTAGSAAPAKKAATARVRRGTGARSRRLAEIIADQIRADIIALGWPVGKVLGSEAELLEKYGVSRSVFRQAVRLLEHHQIARMRPGPGSGLIVAEPDSAATRKALSVYLEYRKVSGSHIMEAMRSMELTCVRLAAERIDTEGVKRLRKALERERSVPVDQARNITENNVHILLAELTGNPALHLFVEVLTLLSVDHVPARISEAAAEATYAAHAEVAEAVISGDVAMAMHAMRMHLDELAEAIC
jgi:DNA-binding FadR family transcriptional regulator